MSDVMSVEALLTRLGQLEVKLRIEGDQLIATPGGSLDDDLREAIATHKVRLMGIVKKEKQLDDAEAQEAAEGDGQPTASSKFGFEPIAGLPSTEEVRQRDAKAGRLGQIIQGDFGFVEKVLEDYGVTVFGAFEFIEPELRVDKRPPKFLTDDEGEQASWAYWGIKSSPRQVVVNLLFAEEEPLCFVVTSKGIVKRGKKGWRTDGPPSQEGLIEALKKIGRK